jgi:UDP-N-acetyl-D-glucosamine dehydrogenase
MQLNAAVSLAQDLKTKIATRTAKVGVIGLGYVGLPLALLFTEETFPVTASTSTAAR